MTELGASSVAGPRPENEDGFLTIDLTPHSDRLGGLRALLVVADGLGGHADGALASRSAIEASRHYIEGLISRAAADQELEVEPVYVLLDMLGQANSAVLEASRKQGAAGMGSTMVAALVGQGRAWVAHVGDSRAYHLKPTGIRKVTTDHSPVARMVAEGVITEGQAMDHPQRNVVDRALGLEGALPDLGKVWLQPTDVLILASDGLFTALDQKAIMKVVISGDDASAAADRLTDAAVKAGTKDNTTVALWAEDWVQFRAAVGSPLPGTEPGVTPPTFEPAATAAKSTATSSKPAERPPGSTARTPELSTAILKAAKAASADERQKQRRRRKYLYLAALTVVAAVAVALAVTTTRSGEESTSTTIVRTSTSAAQTTVVSVAPAPQLPLYRVTGVVLRMRSSEEVGEGNVVGHLNRTAEFRAEPTGPSGVWFVVRREDLDASDLVDVSAEQLPPVVYVAGKYLEQIPEPVAPVSP